MDEDLKVHEYLYAEKSCFELLNVFNKTSLEYAKRKDQRSRILAKFSQSVEAVLRFLDFEITRGNYSVSIGYYFGENKCGDVIRMLTQISLMYAERDENEKADEIDRLLDDFEGAMQCIDDSITGTEGTSHDKRETED